MWYEIFKFEIKYRVKRADTYIFFVFLFLFSLAGTDFIFGGIDLGPIKKNAPGVIAKTMGALSGIFMIIASLIMGVSVIRDFEYNMESLMFVNPIKKRDYLLGRFLGSFTILLVIFSGILPGMVLGEFMPWQKADDLMPFNFFSYLHSFLTIVLPLLFFGAALFFVSGALSRKIMVVYTQGIFFFVVFMLTKAIDNEFLQAILDPFSLTTITEMTEFWSVGDRNSQLIPFNGVLLYNKFFWFAIGVIILWFGYHKFNFNVVKSKSSKKKDIRAKLGSISEINIHLPHFSLHQNFVAQFIQLIRHSLFYFKSILKEVSFWSIVVSGMIIILINSVSLGTVYRVDSIPKTYFIVEELQEMSIYFFIIILVFYSGELIWKERGVKLDEIYDSTPISDIVNLGGKFLGLLLIYVVLVISLILSGVIFQTFSGYFNYELDVYFYGFFLEIFPFLLLYTFIAFFFQAIVNNKFVGFILVLVFFIINMALEFFGFEHDLYKFGGNSLHAYSDMNGYGHFLLPFLWIKAYWFVFGILLLTIASVFTVRGKETNLRKRWRQLNHRITKPILRFGISVVVLFIVIGANIFYNTNILNEYWTNAKEIEFRAGYEQTLKKFEYLPQPIITSVNLKVELYPEKREYTVEGYYILKNIQNATINSIHIQKLIESQVDLEFVGFEGGSNEDNQYQKYGYYIYELNEALHSGDSIKMEFEQSFNTHGFEESSGNISIVKNGTFFNNKDFPTIGYNKKYELIDKNDRKDFGLKPRKTMAARNDKLELKNGRSGADANMIKFEIIIGTDTNQTAIAPGKLLKEWEVNNRKYFHYKMDTPMINFYSIVSANYQVKKDKWTPSHDSLGLPVDLEIYYHKGHEYNLDRMMESMKMSFDYFSRNLSPYQYKQMRIMEFPRYRTFAQSFPGTVPFSEAIGFVLDIDDEVDVDMAFYVTAHELAHQWWGCQVQAANVQGRHMVLETLAQYSALMVLKQRYSEEKVQQFIKMELDAYLKGRASKKGHELPLALVEKQDYIYYDKGVINMFALQDYISEEKVNFALKQFIKDWNSYDGQLQKERYATTNDLLGYFMKVTPDSMKYVIKDLFEDITLFKCKTTNAGYEMLSGDQYKVNLTVEVNKYRTDNLGIEKEIEVNDWIDIGVYREGMDGKDKLVYLKKHKITNNVTELEILVNKKPSKAGVDPTHKLIDKNPENNMSILSKRKPGIDLVLKIINYAAKIEKLESQTKMLESS